MIKFLTQLEPGFYFDKVKNCICFYYVEEENEFFKYYKIYNKETQVDKFSTFGVQIKDKNNSKIENLVDLEEVKNNENLQIDFEWIITNKRLCKKFINYLLDKEIYILLELFKNFAYKRMKN